jgi:glucose/arabinose dehydrogenase
MIKVLAVVVNLLLLNIILMQPVRANLTPIKLDITTIATPNFQVIGAGNERGAAIAKLSDTKFLIGGGSEGSHLYLYDLENRDEKLLARIIAPEQRLNDARFAITDVAVLAVDKSKAKILISYPSYNRANKCVIVRLSAYQIMLGENPTLGKVGDWFTSKPCVPISAVQHAAGRLEVIDKSSAYLTIGDLGYSKIGNKTLRGDLGSIFKVSAGKVEKISSGHRNQQGIVLIGSSLYISEHGPKGGDELNLIKKGVDYGWPIVSYGQRYGLGDYVKPTNPGTHVGYQEPLHYWVPSVAPTELIQLPKNSSWGGWSEQLVMGTLAERALIFIQLLDKEKVGEVVSVDIGQRIRDLEVLNSGTMVATTDSGQLLLINPAT